MYTLQYEVRVHWVGDGSGPMTQAMAQMFRMQPQPGGAGIGETPITGAGGGWPVGPGPVGIVVPGGDAPTIQNFYSALTGVTTTPPVYATQPSLADDIGRQILASLGRIQGFATGGG